MRKIRLYVSNRLSVDSLVVLNKKQSHYLVNVMRVKQFAQVLLFNGIDGEWLAILNDCSSSNIKVIVKNIVRGQIDIPKMTLCFAPVKGFALNNIIRQATEMGVTTLLPICSQFTVIRKANLEKFKSWAIEASEQCERLDIPHILPMIKFFDLQSLKTSTNSFIICDARKKYVENNITVKEKGEIFLIIGPEGGFSQDELEYAQDFCYSISLGIRILRSDTAVVSALAILSSCVKVLDKKSEVYDYESH